MTEGERENIGLNRSLPKMKTRSRKSSANFKRDSSSLNVSSSSFQRRISREGLLDSGNSRNNGGLESFLRGGGGGGNSNGSSDPLLEIPEELSAVLTLKRGVQIRSGSKRGSSSSNAAVVEQATRKATTPLLKRKRESIV